MIDTDFQRSWCKFLEFLEKCRFLPILIHFWAVNVKGRFSNLEYRWFSKYIGFFVWNFSKFLKVGNDAFEQVKKNVGLHTCSTFVFFELFGLEITKKHDFFDFLEFPLQNPSIICTKKPMICLKFNPPRSLASVYRF